MYALVEKSVLTHHCLFYFVVNGDKVVTGAAVGQRQTGQVSPTHVQLTVQSFLLFSANEMVQSSVGQN